MIDNSSVKEKSSQTTYRNEKQENQPDSKNEAWIRRLLASVRDQFSKVKETGKDRRKKSEKKEKQPLTLKNDSTDASKRLPIIDCLMSGLAVFGMKCTSLLQFESRKKEEAIRHNLESLYQVENIPCDTYLRERLDEVEPSDLKRAFKKVFSIIQRNKKLEDYTYLEEGYISTLQKISKNNEFYCFKPPLISILQKYTSIVENLSILFHRKCSKPSSDILNYLSTIACERL